MKSIRDGKFLTYKDLALNLRRMTGFSIPISGRFMGLFLGKLLNKVCREFYRDYGLLPGSIVVSKSKGIPSDGYFRFAHELGLLDDLSKASKIRFWKAQVEKLFKEFH